jgi:DNA polymerase I-like protein with 3'-5' exonuclease and polymerase domains
LGLDIDYSQAELVLLAYLAEDPDFIAAVNSSDLHTATAQGLMGCTEVDKEIRRKAKGVNFLKAYGGGAKKLSEKLKIDESEAMAWLAKWDLTYPRAPAYKMEQQRKWKPAISRIPLETDPRHFRRCLCSNGNTAHKLGL